jgi:hypothetical protein
MKRTASILGSCLLLGALATGILVSAEPEQQGNKNAKPSTEAVERTRKTVRMLDDVYKTTVVLITDKYVNDEDDFPLEVPPLPSSTPWRRRVGMECD